MMISTKYNFAFIHVPKCAGTTIRRQLISFDEENDFFNGHLQHQSLGMIYPGHLPLNHLRNFYPTQFEKLHQVTTYAVCRDPLERFVSALHQYVANIYGQPLSSYTKPEIQNIVDEVLRKLEPLILCPSFEFTFFRRQIDYLYLDNMQFVDKIFPIERIDFLLSDLSELTGHNFDSNIKYNKSFSPRFTTIGPAIYFANKMAWNLFPESIYDFLKNKTYHVFLKPSPSRQTQEILSMPNVKDFVLRFYEFDKKVHNHAIGQLGQPIAPPA